MPFCFSVFQFTLIIDNNTVATQPDDLFSCDVDENDNADIATFNLSQQTNTILGSLDPAEHTVKYYTNQSNADSDSGDGNIPESEISAYSSANTTIYARLENNSSGCFNASTSFNVIVNRKPEIVIEEINANGELPLCIENLPLIIDADTGFSTDTYEWVFNNTIVSTSPELTISNNGTYTLQATSTEGCVSDILEFTVVEQEPGFIESIDVGNFTDPNNITVNISGSGNFLFQLDDNEPQTSNFFPNVPLGPHVIRVIDINGCLVESREVVVIDYPNFFTPNGDSFNDTWHIAGVNTLPGTVVFVYDRFGKLIKTLNYNSSGWDGTFNGEPLPATDYWFKADVIDGENAFEVTGHFSLRR